MFHKRKPLQQTRYTVALTRLSGERVRVQPFEILPLEYFKSFRMIERILALPEQRRTSLLKLILSRLNRYPHRGFDEIYASPPSSESNPFVALEILRGDFDLQALQVAGKRVLIKEEVQLIYGGAK
ncbi:MAG: hypothetical protein EOP06_06460 [Proteobacteria bacterium]|nr:MAG: hypothetical protein EOP06_06460 [Pseudomonadota bacterium]